MIEKNNYFKVFACIKVVKGFKLGILYDLQRKEYVEIPLDLCDILINQNQCILKISEIENTLNIDEIDNFRYLISWLMDKEYLFCINKKTEADWFPEISKEWSNVNMLINAIIDVGENSEYSMEKTVSDLSKINCHSIQIRCFYPINYIDLDKILYLTVDKSFQNIELIIPFMVDYNKKVTQELILKYPNIISLNIYNSPRYKRYSIEQASIFFLTQAFSSEKECGKINKNQFICNLNFFNEANYHNICLNGKISVDINGLIKNCPSMKDNYGNINEIDLSTVLKEQKFRYYWGCKKDQIEVCKDCEYRYMCNDCRAFVKDTGNLFSQPQKCTYNPYIAKWAGEEGFISVEQIGSYINGIFVLDELKLEKYNNSK